MATTPDETQRQPRFQRVREAVESATKGSNISRVVAAAAVALAIGFDRPGTAVSIGALLYLYLGKK